MFTFWADLPDNAKMITSRAGRSVADQLANHVDHRAGADTTLGESLRRGVETRGKGEDLLYGLVGQQALSKGHKADLSRRDGPLLPVSEEDLLDSG